MSDIKRSVMVMSLPEGMLVFETALEGVPPAGVPDLAGAPEPLVGVAVEPVGAGVSLPATEVVAVFAVAEGAAAFADIMKDSRAQRARRRQKRKERLKGQSRRPVV